MSEAKRPPWREKMAALAQEIATVGGRLGDLDETLSRCTGDFKRLEGQVGEVAQLVADLGRDGEGQLDENERVDRRLDALGQDVKAQRHAVAEVRTGLDDLTALVRELTQRQAAETGASGPSGGRTCPQGRNAQRP